MWIITTWTKGAELNSTTSVFISKKEELEQRLLRLMELGYVQDTTIAVSGIVELYRNTSHIRITSL